MQNEGVPTGRILNHLRSKYHNYALCIMNYAFLQFSILNSQFHLWGVSL